MMASWLNGAPAAIESPLMFALTSVNVPSNMSLT
jgi:hypothetical protein